MILLFLIASCQEERSDIIFTEKGSPHLIYKTLKTKKDQSLILEPGAELQIDSGVNIITYGDVIIKGTKEKPIVIKGIRSGVGWGKLTAKYETKKLLITYANISDGIITSYRTDTNFLSHVNFKNTQNLTWESANARFWQGSVKIEHCTVSGIHQAEGILVHDAKDPYVGSCYFDDTPDAVEFINCDRGIIEHNIFHSSGDDAIDLNACRGTIIRYNQIDGFKDCGMEISSERYGRCSNIAISNNRIARCKKGIWVKESSDATSSQDTLVENKTAYALITKKDSLPSHLIAIQNVLDGNVSDQKLDARSILEIK